MIKERDPITKQCGLLVISVPVSTAGAGQSKGMIRYLLFSQLYSAKGQAFLKGMATKLIKVMAVGALKSEK